MSWIIDVNTLCRSVPSVVKYAFSPAAGFSPGFASARMRIFFVPHVGESRFLCKTK